MNDTLRKITERLEENEINYNLIKLKGKAMTAKQVVEFSDGNVNAKEVCKTLILKDKEENTYAVFLVGLDRVSFSKIRKKFNCSDLRMANAEEVMKETGFEVGAVCPLFIHLPILIDRRVFSRKKINFGSGDHYYGIEIETKDILKCTKGKISDIVVE